MKINYLRYLSGSYTRLSHANCLQIQNVRWSDGVLYQSETYAMYSNEFCLFVFRVFSLRGTLGQLFRTFGMLNLNQFRAMTNDHIQNLLRSIWRTFRMAPKHQWRILFYRIHFFHQRDFFFAFTSSLQRRRPHMVFISSYFFFHGLMALKVSEAIQ